MNKIKHLSLFVTSLFILSCSTVAQGNKKRKAAWMEGQWGFRFNMPGMKQPASLEQFDVRAMIDQVKVLDTTGWVQINITQGAHGSYYTAPHAELDKLYPGLTPKRDLFGEMLDALLKEDFKVMVYFATEGPVMGKAPEKAPEGLIKKWKAYAKSLNMTPNQAVAEVIVKEFSKRYGKKISGWWFDHAKYGDIPALKKAALYGNPNAVLSFNMGGSAKLTTNKESDFTAGHPTPMKKASPSSDINETAVKLIEKNNYVKGSLGHFFPPMQTLWNSGDPAFKTEKFLDWSLRIIKAKGSITWAVALADFKKKQAPLATIQFEQLKKLNEAVRKMRNKQSKK